MKEINLSKTSKANKGKYVALVDDEDYGWLSQWNWSILINKNNLYALRKQKINGECKAILMHRQIMGVTDSTIFIDHIDHNGLNNQRNNLRESSAVTNGQNRNPKNGGTSKYLGVYRRAKSTKWRAQIDNGRVIGLGTFDDEIEAAKAYDEAAKIHHKEFANLNFKESHQL